MTPPADETASTGPPDRQTLQLLERHLATESLVEATEFEPDPNTPRLLRAQLDTSQYPKSTETVRLDVRWFTNGDFSVHYAEIDTDDGRWECRWDSHPNAHNSRVHFHEPPDGNTVIDLSLPSLHPLGVYSTVLDAIDQRLANHWEE